jgi:hypothetical protein
VEEKNLAIKQHIVQLKFDEEMRQSLASQTTTSDPNGSSPKK